VGGLPSEQMTRPDDRATAITTCYRTLPTHSGYSGGIYSRIDELSSRFSSYVVTCHLFPQRSKNSKLVDRDETNREINGYLFCIHRPINKTRQFHLLEVDYLEFDYSLDDNWYVYPYRTPTTPITCYQCTKKHGNA
jgi:hypothetical protein